MSGTLLLVIDGGVNLALGFLLALFPRGFAEAVGIPIPSIPFYPIILGGVLIGIGLALFLQCFLGPFPGDRPWPQRCHEPSTCVGPACW